MDLYLANVANHDSADCADDQAVEHLSNEEDGIGGGDEHDGNGGEVDEESAKKDFLPADVVCQFGRAKGGKDSPGKMLSTQNSYKVCLFGGAYTAMGAPLKADCHAAGRT
jgi:hypothetical protein